jgi:hypothetical protein
MILRFLPTVLLLGVLVATAGCASNRLALRLDIYGEDPLSPDLTVPELESFAGTLRGAKVILDEYAEGRLALGDGLYQSYEAMTELFATNRPAQTELEIELEGIAIRKAWWEEYRGQVIKARDRAVESSQSALDQILSYRSLMTSPTTRGDARLRGTWRKTLEAALSRASDDCEKLWGSFGTAFEKSLINQFAGFRESFKDPTGLQPGKDGALASLKREVDGLGRTIERLAGEGSATMKVLSTELKLAKAANPASSGSIKPGLDLVTAISAASPAPAKKSGFTGGDSPLSLGPTEPVADLVRGMVSRRTGGDLDRLQDPGDPVWRTLADPGNARRWHRAFSTNYFYAEGNSSVIIVRDTPMHYRVQRANNNPSALVEGQLRVSRALTDAAIQIAGAATGVKLPNLPKGGTNAPAAGETPAAGSGAAGTGQTVSLTETNARIDAEQAVRRQAFRALRQRLNALRTEFSRTNPTNTVAVAELRSQFAAVIQGLAPVIQPPDTTPR